MPLRLGDLFRIGDALEYDVFVEMGQGRFGAEPARASRHWVRAPDQGGIIAVHSASGGNFTRQEIRRPCLPRDDCIDATHGRGCRVGWRPWPPQAGSFGRRSVSGPEASSPLQGRREGRGRDYHRLLAMLLRRFDSSDRLFANVVRLSNAAAVGSTRCCPRITNLRGSTSDRASYLFLFAE